MIHKAGSLPPALRLVAKAGNATRGTPQRLLEVLHRASTKTVAQLCAGKNALAKIARGTAEYVPTKEEFNNSPDL